MLLGQLHYQGLYGISKNYPMALRYFHAAADRGNEQAATYLGYMYLRGEGVEKDVELARRYFEMGLAKVSAMDRGDGI
jgi:TPR repeat protein